MATSTQSTPSTITILRKRPHGQGGAQDHAYFRKTARGKLMRGQSSSRCPRSQRLLLRLLLELASSRASCTFTDALILPAVVREHYLRPAADFPEPPTLPAGVSWVLPDTNAILHQFDLLASPLFPAPLLIAQTVLDEVRHRSLPLFNKLRTLIDDDYDLPEGAAQSSASPTKMKRGWTIWNEAIEETFLERNEGETPNDRNDRGASFSLLVRLSPPALALGADLDSPRAAIRHVASYYSAILSSSAANKRQKTSASSSKPSPGDAPLILLTDDAANLALARKAGLTTLTAKAYVESLPAAQQERLVDLLAVSGAGLSGRGAGGKDGGEGPFYDEHLPVSVLQAGVKAGKFQQGHFNPSPYNPLGEVRPSLPLLPPAFSRRA